MTYKERLKRALLQARGLTMGMLNEIATPEDWVRRPVPGSNHALWIAGHLGSADNAFIGFMVPEKKVQRDDYSEMFGRGSVVRDSLQDYPDPAQLVEFMKERRRTLYGILDECTEEDFTRPTPDGAPPFMFDWGSVFHMCAWHESLHSGQLTVIHRMLGQPPLVGRE
ncbi:DinB superfamily protein [Maioricimonas rarisocia]|uniref:DinB superfamily protein n=1 Tax=Maioricimonas rarisocia TaxID=2528026 RepID=A0A517Z4J8_9PLAN|nr:DinB family protein [Maioricimonas rarisocia]QDU37355.1 DinB superfamily protein [Maioricimonas rarisocia]